ncbi:MAG: helix-turn-helix domain-containing protein, partial [Sciscionella sp.]
MAAKRRHLAQRRKSLGFTQETFAERLEVDATTVRRWETGVASPQPWLRPKIARHLQVSHEQLDELLTEPAADVVPAFAATSLPAPSTERFVPSSVLLPVMVNGRSMLLPIDAHTLAASNLGPLFRQLAHLDGEAMHSVVTATEWDAMSPLNRRSLLKHGLAASVLPALGLEELHQVAAAMEDARRYLDTSVVEYLRRQLVLAKADDGMLGPAKTVPMVLGILGTIEEHA